jgi:hypothetical protein
VKAAAALPLLAVVLWVWRRHGRRDAAVLVGTAAVIGVVAYLAAGGPAALRPLHSAELEFSGASIWYGPRRWLTDVLAHGRSVAAAGHMARQLLSAAAAALVFALGLLLARRRSRDVTPLVAAGAAAFAYVVGGAYVLPWYVYWGLPALALAWRERLTWLAVAYGAVLYLAEVPDLTAGGDRLFVASPLQRIRSDVYLIWLPLAELVLIVALFVVALRRRTVAADGPEALDYESALLPARGSSPVPTGSSPASTRS